MAMAMCVWLAIAIGCQFPYPSRLPIYINIRYIIIVDHVYMMDFIRFGLGQQFHYGASQWWIMELTLKSP